MEFDEHRRRVNERRTELFARSDALVEEIRRAEAADQEALAEVALDSSKPRPEPTAPKRQEELDAVRREADALILVENKVLAARAEYIEANRKRMMKEAGQ